MNVSRILAPVAALAQAFAADAVQAATPAVTKAVSELPGDLKSSNPGKALLTSGLAAWNALEADAEGDVSKISLTGLFGALANAFLSA